MDASENYAMTIVALVISVGTVVIGVINHKRIRSNCFGRKTEISIDIESTTPNNETPLK